MNMQHDAKPHRRRNPLTGEWLLLSPQRTQRPWQGKVEDGTVRLRPEHDEGCYLCPGNTRMQGQVNPDYPYTYVFDNDFSALNDCAKYWKCDEDGLFQSESSDGTCRVICFSRRHDLTLAEMDHLALTKVVEVWKSQTAELEQKYRWVQVFENKGEIMGCSNPHPHGQIWASDFIPQEPAKEEKCQAEYLQQYGRNLLLTYIEKELEKDERIVAVNEQWVCLVPYWAIWPFETLLVPRRHTLRMSGIDAAQRDGLAAIMKELLVRYDNLFNTSFPYSMGWHGAPMGDGDSDHWQLHAHYYPPLLRSADIKKFMVGYEMLGCPQRDILPEQAAEMIRSQSLIHYKQLKE
ncbi:UDP-glucose--hexose-1-phosphate uridylyltransferase [Desulfopila sp. IMCC35008]|uniref:UDP-glucose--hexose-1-phosphate uridylyltransferase n=1 Tax=Desulfopila sp. IMCC35008 TaxID=2653858 RepID=UPI0013D6050A|nr:UDP-glucose--hexose-1-phosphate uridylyltransferase [Desulfopila sp. IMCC35008]